MVDDNNNSPVIYGQDFMKPQMASMGEQEYFEDDQPEIFDNDQIQSPPRDARHLGSYLAYGSFQGHLMRSPGIDANNTSIDNRHSVFTCAGESPNRQDRKQNFRNYASIQTSDNEFSFRERIPSRLDSMDMMTNSINASRDKIEEAMNPFDNRLKYSSQEDRTILPNFDDLNEPNTLRLFK